VRSRPAVTVTTHPLWRLRLGRELPRRMATALAALALLTFAGHALDPPARGARTRGPRCHDNQGGQKTCNEPPAIQATQSIRGARVP